ncbi:MAG: hypothetical protein KKB31_05970 [Nanoarchaeota archaeon]|nr:hypothetical protein [Nanoarchaeota archaeon]
MKEQCRTCGGWFDEDEMYDTDYNTYTSETDAKLGLTEMVCEGCYNECYGKCSKCGEVRESGHLVRDGGSNWICNPELIS